MRLRLAVMALCGDQLVAWGALYYAYSVLSVPMSEGLGVAPEMTALGFSLALFVSGLAARQTGKLLDRYGARPVLLAGALVGPIALVSLSMADGLPSLLGGFALLGVAHALALYEPAIRAIVDWFPREPDRSRALLVLTIVGGFASAVFLPVAALLARELGWRIALITLAGTVATVCGVVALQMPTPRARERRDDAGRALRDEQRGVQNLLALSFALQSFASTGLSIALVWFLVERGSELASAAALAGLAGASQVPGRILLGPLQHRVVARVRLPALFAIQAAAALTIASAERPLLQAAIVVFGMAAGTMTLERAAVLLTWFGPEGFGARSGRIASATAVARASSPYAVELLRSSVGYPTAFRVLALTIAAGGAVAFAAGSLIQVEKEASAP